MGYSGYVLFFGKQRIEILSANKVRISDGSNSEVMETNRYGNKVVSVIKNEKTGEKSQLTFDKNTGKIYSSETGNPVRINDIADKNEENIDGDISLFSSRRVVQYISYRKISRLVSAWGTVAKIARVVLFLMGSVQNPITALGAISLLVKLIRPGIRSGSSSHGVKITYVKKKHCRKRGLRWKSCYSTYTVVGVGLY